jgi:hypothetical protein
VIPSPLSLCHTRSCMCHARQLQVKTISARMLVEERSGRPLLVSAKHGTGNRKLRTRADGADGDTHAGASDIPFTSMGGLPRRGAPRSHLILAALRASYSPFGSSASSSTSAPNTSPHPTSSTCASLPGAQGAHPGPPITRTRADPRPHPLRCTPRPHTHEHALMPS